MRSTFAPEGRLLDPATDAHDRATVRELVHGGERGRRQARVTHVRVSDQALDLQSGGGLQACSHHHETVLIEAPVADPEAVKARGFGALGKLHQTSGRFVPTDRRQVAEGEFHRAAPATALQRSIASAIPRTVSAYPSNDDTLPAAGCA